MPAGSAMREQTMDEILASIHRMITDGNGANQAGPPSPVVQNEAPGAAPAVTGDDADGWMAEQVAAVLGESVREAVSGVSAPRDAEPLERKVGRRFVDGLVAGAEDVALIDAAKHKVETRMSEQQRASVTPVRPEPTPRAVGEPSARHVAPSGDGRDAGEERLLSEQTNGAVGASFDTLSRTILAQNPRTLEDLVRDLLRPMLRSWLDQNLPRMVERMVKQEIDRISRGER
jgi:cell pole-organizing protein PopZ